MEARRQVPCLKSWAVSLVCLAHSISACLFTDSFSAVMVFLLVLLALLLYKYRYKRHVQAFLGKVTPFRISPYTKSEKKRSSMGAGLLFTNGYHGVTLINEKRSTNLPAPVTYPDPAATRPESPDGPPQLITTLGNRRPSSPISPFYVSPLSIGFPQIPAPTVPRRSSQESLGSISITSSDILSPFLQTVPHRSSRDSLSSIASSGIFSLSLLSWPVPPSVAPSVGTSPPATSSSHINLSELAACYKPLTPLKPTTPMQPMTPVQPATPPK
jgi:hypothetical protein